MTNDNLSPVAIVCGEPLTKVPSVLYIPPEALHIHLQSFEGPLDLLLFLVRKHKFDILDIPMVALSKQYAIYVEEVVTQNIEIAADYLTMLALLVEIKTKMLLPRPVLEEDNEEDPRADLVRRLLEYERIRKMADKLEALPRRGRDFVSPHITIENKATTKKPALQALRLVHALSAILIRKKQNAAYVFVAEPLSVREVMSNILRRLKNSTRSLFSNIASPGQGGVTFLALLQLALENRVALKQKTNDDELYIDLNS